MFALVSSRLYGFMRLFLISLKKEKSISKWEKETIIKILKKMLEILKKKRKIGDSEGSPKQQTTPAF